MLKKLINLANKLDRMGHTKVADTIDEFLKTAQFVSSKINKNDFLHAVEFYNNTSVDEIDPNSLSLQNVSIMSPKAFLPELDISDKGWLREYPEEDWGNLLTEKHGRNFSHIISMYRAGRMNPAIQINGSFADGLARALFYNAVGENMPVASFISN